MMIPFLLIKKGDQSRISSLNIVLYPWNNLIYTLEKTILLECFPTRSRYVWWKEKKVVNKCVTFIAWHNTKTLSVARYQIL